MSNTITHCISCEGDKIKKKRGPFPVTIHGTTIKIPDIESYVCSECGEIFLDLDNETKIDIFLQRQRTNSAATS